MKNKIKDLIREVGINEVESILQEIKSKVNVKEDLKKDFIDLLNGCNISFNNDDIDYKKDGNLLFYYRKIIIFFGLNMIFGQILKLNIHLKIKNWRIYLQV